MNSNYLDKEAKFFREISPVVLEVVAKKFRKSLDVRHKTEDKTSLNFVTQADLDVDKTLIEAIRERFPKDKILSEESYQEQEIGKGRIWVLDPICGTANFSRELANFVTNIALAEDGKLVASCAVDHNLKEFIWSVGRNKIFINDELQKVAKKSPGVMIDVDLGAIPDSDKKFKESYLKFVSRLASETNYTLVTYNTSLNFAYTALGRIDAYISPFIKVWDVAAANFLIIQAGGVVTELSGRPWGLDSTSAVAARDKDLHKQLLGLLFGWEA